MFKNMFVMYEEEGRDFWSWLRWQIYNGAFLVLGRSERVWGWLGNRLW